jgi:Na+/melibiose symporter-like transporter
MFYGFRNFTTKFGISIANLLFPSLLLFGRSTENHQGVILTAWMALIFCIIGFALFYFVKDLEEA